MTNGSWIYFYILFFSFLDLYLVFKLMCKNSWRFNQDRESSLQVANLTLKNLWIFLFKVQMCSVPQDFISQTPSNYQARENLVDCMFQQTVSRSVILYGAERHHEWIKPNGQIHFKQLRLIVQFKWKSYHGKLLKITNLQEDSTIS